MTPEELQSRLVSFAVLAIELSKSISKNYAGTVLKKQLIRSATSSALNYGEARSGESPKDFVHKLRVVLKELRESQINLEMLNQARLVRNAHSHKLQQENSELIAIIVASIRTSLDKNN
jgi:four helix bundle protein